MAARFPDEFAQAAHSAALATLGTAGTNEVIAERHTTAHPDLQCDCPIEVLLAIQDTGVGAKAVLARPPWWALDDLFFAVLRARLPRGYTPDLVDPRFTALHPSGALLGRTTLERIRTAAPLLDELNGLAWVFERGEDTTSWFVVPLGDAGAGRFPLNVYERGHGWAPFGWLLPAEMAQVIHDRWPRTRIPGRRRQRDVITAALGHLPSTFQA